MSTLTKSKGTKNKLIDIIQDLFATLWFERELDLNTSNLASYLFTAVRNRIFDLFAHEQVKSSYVDSFKDYLSAHARVPAITWYGSMI